MMNVYNEYSDYDMPMVKTNKSLNELNKISYGVKKEQSTKKGFNVGAKVNHTKFGYGEIIATSGSGINIKVTIKFDTVGVKDLLLEYAPLTLV